MIPLELLRMPADQHCLWTTLASRVTHATVRHVISIGRKRLGISHSKLTEVLHSDFANCPALAESLTDQDALIFCLGVYTGAVPEAKLRGVTVDYTREVVRVFRRAAPRLHSHF
jgi:hypothetical protein